MDILIHQNSYFIFDEVKKYAGSIEGIADIFQYISKYKEIAAVYGNCQSLYISQLLCKSNEFKMQYIMCRFTFIQNIVDEKKTGFDEKYMKYIDLFIYQIAKRDNAFGENLSTECILPLLKENAIKISIPFIYFNAYFPQYIKNTRNDDVRRGEGHAPYGDSKIQYYAENGLGIDAIVENLKGDNLFSYEEIQRNLQNTIEALSVREKECDIQILDYILENYKDEYLFYSPSHPTNICQAELAKRILRYLGMDDTLRDYQDLAENDRTEMFIYPSVRKHLELTFEKKSFVLYREDKNEGSLYSFVSDYIRYCFPERQEDIKRDFRTIDCLHLLDVNREFLEERRTPVFEISGVSLHLSLYLTIKKDNVNGIIFRVNKNYAPKTSFIFPVMGVSTGGVFPCILYPSGEGHLNSTFKKGQVVFFDITWFKK